MLKSENKIFARKLQNELRILTDMYQITKRMGTKEMLSCKATSKGYSYLL